MTLTRNASDDVKTLKPFDHFVDRFYVHVLSWDYSKLEKAGSIVSHVTSQLAHVPTHDTARSSYDSARGVSVYTVLIVHVLHSEFKVCLASSPLGL